MNELIAKLYDQALVLESNGDYVCGELDPVKFAELIVAECIGVAVDNGCGDFVDIVHLLLKHFGVE